MKNVKRHGRGHGVLSEARRNLNSWVMGLKTYLWRWAVVEAAVLLLLLLRLLLLLLLRRRRRTA